MGFDIQSISAFGADQNLTIQMHSNESEINGTSIRFCEGLT